jgi:hypothetical protein
MVKKNKPSAEALDGKMVMDGYDECICGVIYRFNTPDIVCYDLQKLIRRHQKDGMTREEAYEFWQFNQLGAGMGDLTPCFLDKEVY